MRRPWLLGVAVMAASACTTTAHSRAFITLPTSTWPPPTQVRWYDVEGDSEPELRAALDAKGPQDAHGDRNDAYTSWYVTWHFPFEESAEGCGIGPVTTQVRVTVTLPRWRGFADERNPLTQRWRRYLEALQVHESGHRDHGFLAAAEITDVLPKLPLKPTCDEAEVRANEKAKAILEAYNARDAEYDEETKHGATQGALFP